MKSEGVVAFVTGGGSGLGQATAETLVAQGGKAVIYDLSSEHAAAVAQKLGDSSLAISGDVCDEEQVKSALQKAKDHFGQVNVCINCAGIGNAHKTYGKKGPFPLDAFKHLIEINLIGTFNVIRLAAEVMASNPADNEDGERGVIINTASVAAYDGQIGQAAYSASKGGIVGMTLPVARDLASLGIRVNTIVPGIMNTPLFNMIPEEQLQALGSTVLYPKRLGHSEEFASLAAHIVSNGYINGECIRLDGGIRMTPR